MFKIRPTHGHKIPRLLLQLTLVAFAAVANTQAAEIYKYRDAEGRWVFTDKQAAGETVEKVEYKSPIPATKKPQLSITKKNGWYNLVVDNPFYAPIEVVVKFESQEKTLRTLVPANAKTAIKSNEYKIPAYQYRWTIGDPKAKVDNTHYLFPVASKSEFTITQSFQGQFSHHTQPSLYAVDIAMPIGTIISAARAGIVIAVKDDYHMGGRDGYFLDKANYVMVLHSDGTYATYAHILLGGALVKAGDSVNAGDPLARSGTSGFSTGPHLHFVMKRNTGMKTMSVPFKFIDSLGNIFTPRKGLRVAGQ